MFKKKTSILALVIAFAAVGITGCGTSNASAGTNNTPNSASSDTEEKETSNSSDNSGSDKYNVVCTIFPEYDWVKEIVGSHAENFDITYLLDNGVDLHSYQPTADDMLKISSCDLFVYVGGESDEWVDDILETANNKDMKVIDLMDILGDSAKEEELKEGMQGEEEEEDEEEGEEEGPEYDEHVWLSLKNAEILCTEIESSIAEIDPANSADYKANLDSYISKLDELDGKFKTLVDGASVKTLVFGDRFPFRYFVDDYGLDYYAAFIGCSAESEASFETIAFLADKVKELDCDTVFTLENSNKSIAEAIISTSGKDVKIAELNSLQSVSNDEIKSGVNYISLMEKNYDVLKETLK